jgi:cell division transport system ATP-binding protein
MEEQPLISYQHVNVSLQGQEILSDVNLELRKGEFVYLIGKAYYFRLYKIAASRW